MAAGDRLLGTVYGKPERTGGRLPRVCEDGPMTLVAQAEMKSRVSMIDIRLGGRACEIFPLLSIVSHDCNSTDGRRSRESGAEDVNH